MTFKQLSKRQVIAAATALTIAGLGVACSFGGGSTAVTAVREGRAAAAVAPAASVQAGAVVDGATDLADATAGTAAERAALRTRRALRLVGAADRITVSALGTSASTSPAGTQSSTPAGDGGADDAAEQTADIALRIPQRVSVSLPKVSNVQLPRVEGGSVSVGTLPAVQPGWKTTVDLGDPEPQVTLPKVHVGPVATVTMPRASID